MPKHPLHSWQSGVANAIQCLQWALRFKVPEVAREQIVDCGALLTELIEEEEVGGA